MSQYELDRPVPCLLHVIEYRVIHYPVRRITYIRHVMQRYPGPDKPNIRLYFRFPIALGINGSRFSFRYFRNRRKYYDRGLYRRFFYLYRPKFSLKSILLTIRNIGYMVKLGFSAFLTEAAIACMMLVGNYIFMRYLGEDGVAAYSVACYCFPIVFMVNNAIAQSTQPIISYNYGIQQWKRVRQAFKLALLCAVVCGGLACVGTILFCPEVSSLFLGNHGNAYEIAVSGIPYFSLGYVFFALNIVCIGYYQSIERFKPATLFTILRGIVIITLSFMYLPVVCGIKGIWLAVPLSELITFVIIVVYYLLKRTRA